MSPRDVFILMITVVVWGSNFVATRLVLDELSPFTALALRFVGVSLILLPFIKFVPGQMLRVIGAALTVGLGHLVTLSLALLWTDSVAAVSITLQLYVPFSLIFAALFLKETVGIVRSAAVAVSFAGVVFLAIDDDLALGLEHERDGPGGAQRPAALLEDRADVAHGAGVVVREAVDDDGGAPGPVPLEGDLLEVVALPGTGALFDGALDGVLGHVGVLGFVDRVAEGEVGVGVGPALACGGHDGLGALGPDLALLLVLAFLAVADVRPFAVAGHGESPCRAVPDLGPSHRGGGGVVC